MQTNLAAVPIPYEREACPPDLGGELNGPRRLHLIMGQTCNVRCVMCYQTDHSDRGSMPAAVYEERLGPVYGFLESVKLQGGEPTVMRNCRELGALLRGLPHVRVSLSTNGIRLDGFWSDLLLNQGGHVDVSLNAASESAYRAIVRGGSFRSALGNVRALAAARIGPWPKLGLSLVVLKENFAELPSFAALARELGVDAVKFAIDPILSFAGLPGPKEVAARIERTEEAGRGLQIIGLEGLRRHCGLTSTKAEVRPSTCPLPCEQAVVDANGEVRACVATWTRLGNLYDASLGEIWRGARATGLRQRVAAGDHSTCDAWCPFNPAPRRTALLSKYAFYCAHDPLYFARKLRHKLRQLRRRAQATASAA